MEQFFQCEKVFNIIYSNDGYVILQDAASKSYIVGTWEEFNNHIDMMRFYESVESLETGLMANLMYYKTYSESLEKHAKNNFKDENYYNELLRPIRNKVRNYELMIETVKSLEHSHEYEED